MIRIRRPWKSQPPSALPLAQRYGFASSNSKVLLPLFNGITTLTRPEVMSLDFANGNPYRRGAVGAFLANRPNQYTVAGECKRWYSTDKFVPTTSDWTMLFVVSCLNITTYPPRLSYGADNDSGSGWGAAVSIAASTASCHFANTSPTGYSATITLNKAIADNEVVAIVGTKEGNTIRVFCRGQTASATTTGSMRTSTNGLQSTSNVNDGACGYGNTYLAGMRVGALSPGMAAELSVNPWSLFTSLSRYIPLSAAASGIPTLSDPGWIISGNQFTPRGTYTF